VRSEEEDEKQEEINHIEQQLSNIPHALYASHSTCAAAPLHDSICIILTPPQFAPSAQSFLHHITAHHRFTTTRSSQGATRRRSMHGGGGCIRDMHEEEHEGHHACDGEA